MNKNKKTDKSIDYIESERAFLEGLTGKPVSRYKAQDITDDIDKLFRSLSKIEQGKTIDVYPEQLKCQTIRI